MAEHVATKSKEYIPAEWPGAFGLFSFSKKVVLAYLWPVIWLTLGSVIISSIGNSSHHYGLLSLLTTIATVLLSLYLTRYWLAGMRREKITFSEIVDSSWKLALPYFFSTIIVIVLLGLSFLAFVIPFFFVLPRLVFVQYFVVDGMSAVDAVKASWARSKGYEGKVYGIVGASIAMILPAFTIIGIPFTIYWVFLYSAATAVLYGFALNKVHAKQEAKKVEAAAKPKAAAKKTRKSTKAKPAKRS